MRKPRRKSRTYWFAIALTVLGPIASSADMIRPLLTPAVFAISSIVIGVVIAVLRELTKDAVGKEDK